MLLKSEKRKGINNEYIIQINIHIIPTPTTARNLFCSYSDQRRASPSEKIYGIFFTRLASDRKLEDRFKSICFPGPEMWYIYYITKQEGKSSHDKSR